MTILFIAIMATNYPKSLNQRDNWIQLWAAVVIHYEQYRLCELTSYSVAKQEIGDSEKKKSI